MNKEARLKKLAQKLLATTCLTAAAAGMASASSFTEGADLSNSAGSPTVLSAGITTLVGQLCPDCSDSQDWFDIPGLAPGVNAHITITASSGTGLAQIGFLGDGFVSQFGPAQFHSEGGVITTDIPVSAGGDLEFGITPFGQNGFGVNYTVTIAQQVAATPEPGTFAAGALALAGAVALRRKRKQS